MENMNLTGMRKGNNWTLQDEKKYLDFLGTHEWSKSVQMSRRDLLINYIKITPERKEPWVESAVEYAKKLLSLLCLIFICSCAYGQYDQSTGLFWATESPMQRFYRQDNENWNRYYQIQQLNQMQQMNNNLRWLQYGR